MFQNTEGTLKVYTRYTGGEALTPLRQHPGVNDSPGNSGKGDTRQRKLEKVERCISA